MDASPYSVSMRNDSALASRWFWSPFHDLEIQLTNYFAEKKAAWKNLICPHQLQVFKDSSKIPLTSKHDDLHSQPKNPIAYAGRLQ
jgi:hypothetical protein